MIPIDCVAMGPGFAARIVSVNLKNQRTEGFFESDIDGKIICRCL
jgi:hypothetical protein